MDNQTKRKNAHMKAIMSNPKLSKIFNEAIRAPIGSTKRDQARSTFSAMNKVRNFDGQGGLTQDVPTPETKQNSGYSNVIIFPAAPKLKTRSTFKQKTQEKPINNQNIQKSPYPDGQGGLWGDKLKKGWDKIKNAFDGVSSPISINTSLPGSGPFSIYNVFKPKTNKTFEFEPAEPLPYDRGMKGKLEDLRTNIDDTSKSILSGTLDTIGRTGRSIPAAVAGMGEYVGKNVGTAFKNINKWYTEGDPSISKSYGPEPYTKWEDTWGSKKIAEIMEPIYSPLIKTGTSTGSREAPIPTKNYKKYRNVQDVTKDIFQSSTQGKPQDTSQETTTGSVWDRIKKMDERAGSYSSTSMDTGTDTGTYTGTRDRTSAHNLAARNISERIGIDPYTRPEDLNIDSVMNGIMDEEGFFSGASRIAIENKNPGNLKFVGQEGAVRGTKSPDGEGYFAKFETFEDGTKALRRDLEIKINSGRYDSFNDLMNDYTPNKGKVGGLEYERSFYGGSSQSSQLGQTGNISGAQRAVDENIGSAQYALNRAETKYGGNQAELSSDIEERLRKKHNIEELELALSEAKENRTNLKPTLQDYMRGRDEYIEEVDGLIEKAEGSIMDLDMGNPAVRASYENNLAYLYQLKGKQTARYGNFLESALNDADTDILRLENDYNRAYDRYEQAVSNETNIMAEDYKNDLIAWEGLYNSLENAPLVRSERIKAELEMIENSKEILNISLDGYTATNDELLKQTQVIEQDLSSGTDGGLNLNRLTEGGLPAAYQLYKNSGYDERATTTAIIRTMQQGLNNVRGDEELYLKRMSNYKELLDELEADEDEKGKILATNIKESIQPLTNEAITSYVATNFSEIKKAIEQLEEGNISKETWQNDNDGLNKYILGLIFDEITKDPLYLSNPEEEIKVVLKGANVDILNRIISLITAKVKK